MQRYRDAVEARVLQIMELQKLQNEMMQPQDTTTMITAVPWNFNLCTGTLQSADDRM